MAGGLKLRHPGPRHLSLMRFQPVADIAGFVGRALGIDHDRQIAADAERIHVVEKDRPLDVEHVLYIVLGGDEQHVEPRLLHQPVKLVGIKGNGPGGRSSLDAVLHDAFPYLLWRRLG